MKKNNLIRILSATLSLLMLVCCIGTNFSPAKYKGTFDGVDIGLTVNAEPTPEYKPALAYGETWYKAGGTTATDNKSYVYTIDIVDTYTKSDSLTYVAEWDASEDKDGSVMCYMYEAYDSNGDRIQVRSNPGYNLVIAGNGSGKIYTNKNSEGAFKYFQGAIEINGLEVLDTSQTTNFNSFFDFCEKVIYLDLREFDTSKATSMNRMFAICGDLQKIDIDESFDTSNVTTMSSMFFYCYDLEEIDVSNWNTSKVESMYGLFCGCGKLKVIDVSRWNTSSLKTQGAQYANYTSGGIFNNCSSVTELDVSNWDVSNLDNFMDMFNGCSGLTELDLSSFDTSKATNMYRMFYGCKNLKTIYATERFTAENVVGTFDGSETSKSADMFAGCTNLVGGNGTVFDPNYIDKTYAKIDGWNDQIGYLTLAGEVYTLIYHTFDETGADVVYKTQKIHEKLPVTIEESPSEHENLNFLGWSPQGTWISDEESEFYPEVESQVGNLNHSSYVPEARYIFNPEDKGLLGYDLYSTVLTTEIHLYDIYSDYYCFIDGTQAQYEPMSLDWRCKMEDTVLFERSYFTRNVLPLNSNGVEASYGLSGKTRTHYVHPGMVVNVTAEDSISSSDDYEYDTTITYNSKSADSHTVTMGMGTITFIVKNTRSKNSSSTCFAAGTLITMADGSKLPIEEVEQGDMVRVYDHENGCYTESPILFTEYDGDKEYLVTNLEFSDGTTQKFIYDHALFDLDMNEYVYITPKNCEEFIGHRFAKERSSGHKAVTLEKAWAEVEYTGCYSMTTAYHMNYFVNGMFSMPGGIPGLFNFFEYDEDLKYDPDLMERDIERYGLFTYDDFADYMPEAVFEQIFPIKYLKVSIGKGLTTFEDLEEIIERYIYGHDLLDDFEELPEEELEETEDLEENTEENGETETKDESTDEEKSTLNFEVENLTFDLADNEIVTNEDVVITFTAGEGYELPETIVITIDGEEYIIYTCEEDSDKNPEGITFDIETGTLTISKDLLKDTEAITIAAEGIKKEDEESEDNKENTDADKKDESKDKDNTDNENESEGGETTDKETENGTNSPDDDKTETEGGTDDSVENNVTEPEDGTDVSGGENTETTTPETNHDNSTEGEAGGGNNSEDNGEDEGKTETPEPDTDVTTPTTPDKEDGTNTEQGGEKVETEGNGVGSNENGTEETIPDTEGSDDEETTIPTEPTTPAEPSEPAVSPETPKTETPSTSEPTTGGNDDDNGETGSADSSSTESSSNSGNDSPESDASNESTTSTTPSVTPPAPTTPAPATNETNTSSASTQASSNSSNAPASSAPTPNADSNSNGASQASGTTAPSGSKETSSEE